MGFLANPANRAWLVLLVATAITWELGETGAAGVAAMLTMLGLAWVKGHLVIYDFMELRGAPLLWRVLLQGWLTVVVGLIILAYWMGLK